MVHVTAEAWAGNREVCRGTPLPLGFAKVFILKTVKVVCFDTLLQVLILKVVKSCCFGVLAIRGAD